MSAYGERTELLIGTDAVNRLASALVVVAGVGGVGGHCAEALARAGIGRLHLIDADTVSASNLNRQLVAAKNTVGQKKVLAARARLESVSESEITTADAWIDEQSVGALMPARADFIVDAIDSLSGKLALIGYAEANGIPIISCMGAGNRLEPWRFRIMDVFKTEGDPLARRLRNELRKRGISSLSVVFSDEPPHTEAGQTVIGSIAPVPAAAGLCAAGYVIQRLTEGYRSK